MTLAICRRSELRKKPCPKSFALFAMLFSKILMNQLVICSKRMKLNSSTVCLHEFDGRLYQNPTKLTRTCFKTDFGNKLNELAINSTMPNEKKRRWMHEDLSCCALH